MSQHRLVQILTGLLLLTGAATSHADLSQKIGHASNPAMAHDRGHVLVKIEPGRSADVVLRGSKARRLFGRWYRVEVASGELAPSAVDRFARKQGTEIVELDYLVSAPPISARALSESDLGAALVPSDPFYNLQWNMPLIGMPQAWDQGRGSGATIAIIDSGISSLGQDLTCHTFVDPYNAITGMSGPGAAEDDAGHGTHVAGTAAQCTNNGVGVAGVADGARLMPVKVLDFSGNGSFADAAAGIDWATDHGADVINLSLGAHCDSGWPSCSVTILNEAIDRAVAMDVVVVVAAGNAPFGSDYGLPFISLPANHPDVIPVTAIDYSRDFTSYSNFDLALEHDHILAGPGGDTTQPLNGQVAGGDILQEVPEFGCGGFSSDPVYCFYDGTSMATPHVAGAAAILRALYPEATREEIMQALEASAEDLGSPGYDSFYGHGLIQVDQAIDLLADLVTAEPFTCVPGNNVLCVAVDDETFEVTMDWEGHSPGQGGKARAVELDNVGITLGGAFYFTNIKNPEVLIKFPKWCNLSTNYAVFYAATTDVDFTIKVRQASTGYSEVYVNTLGQAAPSVIHTKTRFPCP